MAPSTKRFSTSLKENETLFKSLVGEQRGAILRRVPVPDPPGAEVLLVFFEIEMDQARLELVVIRPIVEGEIALSDLPDHLPPSTVKMKSVDHAIENLFRGKVLLIRDGTTDVYAIEIAKPPFRSITPPETESGVSGPRESFTEIHVINLAMIRRRYPGPALRAEELWIGKEARLEV
ncbi:MAG: gerKA3, partial [Symbiobacteriaceae bacterium]|nr:gerKA3 [Symbiobacteriaceae bacterium]